MSSGDKTLNSIDHSVVEAGRFLQEYATDPTKRECLEAFAECQNIVEWIRKETNGIAIHDIFLIFTLFRCYKFGQFCNSSISYSSWWRGGHDN